MPHRRRLLGHAGHAVLLAVRPVRAVHLPVAVHGLWPDGLQLGLRSMRHQLLAKHRLQVGYLQHVVEHMQLETHLLRTEDAMKTMRQTMRQQQGQGMTEYIIIVALIAISCIAVVMVFGDNIRKIFGSSVNALANQSTSSTGSETAAGTSLHKNIQDFANADQG